MTYGIASVWTNQSGRDPWENVGLRDQPRGFRQYGIYRYWYGQVTAYDKKNQP